MTEIRFERISKRFGDRDILDDVCVSLVSGECQLLCGANGAGKSTLLRILAGMEAPNGCDVVDAGQTRRWRRVKANLLRDVIYLHQLPYLFAGTVAYNLNYPLRGSRATRAAQVRRGLEWSGLTALADQPVHQLSGGERQRVALARAWLRGPKIMLLDEPTTNMDQGCRRRTVELLASLKETGVALVVATHDTGHFADIGDRVLRLENAVLREESSGSTPYPEKVTPITARARTA
ncbi:MAG: energy-coupling factor ABC transporter ATP-binding protein [Gammaproteobacteria bacterium]|nr:energy-coupling factor ABC transporter ATP-binding protein [Gammaproteobacteria bacterium]